MMDVEHQWISATWDGAAEQSLRAGAKLTLAEKLAWLQEVRRLSDSIEARRREREEMLAPLGQSYPASR